MPLTVLVVDDNAAMRKALCRLFIAAGGFEICVEAATGEEALEKVRDLNPQLIVLDLCMPGMNGLETARRLQPVSHPPIILYSMMAEHIQEREAFQCGVSAVVSKAEGIRTLLSKARSMLNADPAA